MVREKRYLQICENCLAFQVIFYWRIKRKQYYACADWSMNNSDGLVKGGFKFKPIRNLVE